jgi:feruloyl esterase
MRLVRDEVLRQCDALDGLADGVINNYYDCLRRFDGTDAPQPFARLRCADGTDMGQQCLSDAQLATITAMHAPVAIGFPLAGGESDAVGQPVGQEIIINTSFETPGAFGFPVLETAPTTVNAGELAQRYPAKTFDLVNKTFKDYQQEIQAMSAIVDQPTDLSALLSGKTKFILHSAASDYTVNARGAMRFYDEVVKRHGQAAIDRAVRFYVTPNGEHGSVGHSATTGTALPHYADLMGALRTWVEKDVAPESLVQTLEETTPPYTVLRSRPLCRYPRYPRYKGTGHASDAQSYACVMPQSSSSRTTTAHR